MRIVLAIENGRHFIEIAAIADDGKATSLALNDQRAPAIRLMRDFLTMRLGETPPADALALTPDEQATTPAGATP